MGSSRKRTRGKAQQQQQARLTFNPVAGQNAGGTPGTGPPPARVGYLSSPGSGGGGRVRRRETSPSGSGSRGSLPVRSSPLAKRGPGAKARARARARARQQTLEASLDRGKATRELRKQIPAETDDDDDELLAFPIGKDVKVGQRPRPAPSPPRSSFMKGPRSGRRAVVEDSGDETPVEEVKAGISDSDGEGPLKQETPRGPTQVVFISDENEEEDQAGSSDDEEPQADAQSSQSLPNQAAFDDDDSDDQPLVTPRSSMPGRRGRRVVNVDEEDEDEDDEDIQTPAKRRRLIKTIPAHVSLSPESSEGEGSNTARLRSRGKLNSRARGSPSPPPASTTRSTRSDAPKVHRSEKQKKMELLQRRRAGEKDLTMEDLESSEGEEAVALYDTDEELQALDVFDDESEPEEAAPAPERKSKKNAKKRQPARNSSPRDDGERDDDANSEDEAFIDDDDDTLGVPNEALHLIPLEFTRASRKPLKDHFGDAVEWLIQRRINPGFDREDEVYATAWRRLSDEVTGLANSKFISSVWRPDFHRALRARPYIEQMELGFGHRATDTEKCQACGRSGHPATWSIQFRGKPYSDKTMDEVESDSEDEDEDEDDDEEKQDRDADGNPIPPEHRSFLVGSQCNSNADTAHSLTHWKVALRDWVEARLESEGWMAPDRIVAREKMKPRRRARLAAEIAGRWHEGDVVRNLFLDFKSTIDAAREKDPTKVSRSARRW